MTKFARIPTIGRIRGNRDDAAFRNGPDRSRSLEIVRDDRLRHELRFPATVPCTAMVVRREFRETSLRSVSLRFRFRHSYALL